MAKIIGLVTVKNEADIIKKMLDRNGGFMDFVIIDNGSTDGSYGIIKAHPKVLEHIQDNGEYNENRLIKKLLQMADKYNADWYFEIDADEIIADEFVHLDLDKLNCNCVTFKIEYRLPDERVYKIYDYWQRLYRNYGLATLLGGCDKEIEKLHKGKNPIERKDRTFYHSHIPIYHYQLRTYEQGMRKYNNYVALDTELKQQSRGYDHIRQMANMLKTRDFTGIKFH